MNVTAPRMCSHITIASNTLRVYARADLRTSGRSDTGVP
jgi:hypothetical protein